MGTMEGPSHVSVGGSAYEHVSACCASSDGEMTDLEEEHPYRERVRTMALVGARSPSAFRADGAYFDSLRQRGRRPKSV